MRRIHPQPRFYGILIALMLVFFGVSCLISQHRLNLATYHADALALEKSALESELRSLNAELEYVQSDEYILRAARNDLKLIYPNEIRYVAK